jgi:hypothetical protein
MVVESNLAALDFMEQAIKREKINCDFSMFLVDMFALRYVYVAAMRCDVLNCDVLSCVALSCVVLC